MMKWWDIYFLSFLVIGIVITATMTLIFYNSSPLNSYVSVIIGVGMIIGVLMDWKGFRKRHNL